MSGVTTGFASTLLLNFNRFKRDFGFEQFFNIHHQALIACRHKTNRTTQCTRTSRTTNAVHVIFGVERNVEVKHRRHIFDI